MKCIITYRRCDPNTVEGETLVITQRYSTFDTQEMDKFEDGIRANIGSGVLTEFNIQAESEKSNASSN